MSFVFASQFEVIPQHGQTGPDCATAVVQDVISWIEGHRRYRGQPKFKLPINGGIITPVVGDEIKLEHNNAGMSHLYKIDFTHVDGDDRTMLWSTIVKVASNENIAEVSVVLRKSSTTYVIKPANPNVARPRIIDTLLQNHTCQMNGIEIPTQPIRLRQDDISVFVEHYLLNSRRSLPIVMVSPEVETDCTVIRTPPLAEDLIGVAIVVELADVGTAYELTHVLGSKQLSCYNGAIRVYWPGLTRESNSLDHPLFLADDVYNNDLRDKPLGQYLFRIFSEIVSLRFTDGLVIRQARNDISVKVLSDNKSKIDELDATRSELREKHEFSEEADRICDLYTEENDKLKTQIAELNRRCDALVEENRSIKDNWNAFKDYSIVSTGEKDSELGSYEVSSVLSALQSVARLHSDILEVWSDAEDSAKESLYGNFMEVHEALAAVARVGRKWLEANEAGTSMGGDWKALIKEEGFDCRPHEGLTTMSKYGNDRVFKDRDTAKSELMLMHIALGNGGADNCLRIYFLPKDDKIYIGHCGEHKKIASRS